MTSFAIHFRLPQMRSQFSWTLHQMIRLWILPPNAIPSCHSFPLPIVHLYCFVWNEHHQVKSFPPSPPLISTIFTQPSSIFSRERPYRKLWLGKHDDRDALAKMVWRQSHSPTTRLNYNSTNAHNIARDPPLTNTFSCCNIYPCTHQPFFIVCTALSYCCMYFIIYLFKVVVPLVTVIFNHSYTPFLLEVMYMQQQ